MVVVKMNDADCRALIEAAKKAAEFAYRPYSKYNVGAAILTFDNKIYVGCNVENYGYSQTIHAEQAAACNAIAYGALQRALQQGLTKSDFIKALAVFSPKASPTMPCFGCRQFLSEFGTNFTVLVEDANQRILSFNFSELVPNPFSIEAVANSVAQAPV